MCNAWCNHTLETLCTTISKTLHLFLDVHTKQLLSPLTGGLLSILRYRVCHTSPNTSKLHTAACSLFSYGTGLFFHLEVGFIPPLLFPASRGVNGSSPLPSLSPRAPLPEPTGAEQPLPIQGINSCFLPSCLLFGSHSAWLLVL